jgi:hypothetical protein
MSPGGRARGEFPSLVLADPDGRTHALREAWQDGDALVLIGHRDCSTTLMAIPYFERIHRRRAHGTAVLVLQDDAAAARELGAELALSVPIRLEPPPYPLAFALQLEAVPTLFVVERGGRIARVAEGFDRGALEAVAGRMGIAGALFDPSDRAPPFRPG